MPGIGEDTTFLFATLATTAAMIIILPTIDGPYLTTNSPPPPTTHLALNVCEALRHPSLCEARDVKDEDKLVHWAYGLFSGKQLTVVMCLELRKQKPLSNALDGLYLLCEEHIRPCWYTVEAGKLVNRKSVGVRLHPRGVDFHHMGDGDIPSIPFL